jgi:hypothetical protein
MGLTFIQDRKIQNPKIPSKHLFNGLFYKDVKNVVAVAF